MPDNICNICGNGLLDDLSDYSSFAEGRAEHFPFLCDECGGIRFPIKAIRDIIFIKPEPVDHFPHSDIIEVPEFLKPHELSGYGFVLSMGPGYYDNKGRFWPTHTISVGQRVVFDKDVADLFTYPIRDYDKNYYQIVTCGFGDVKAECYEETDVV